MDEVQLIEVVISEDNLDAREEFVQVLNSTEHINRVVAYANCEEAIANVVKDQGDVYLMDLEFPGMHGVEGMLRPKKINHHKILLYLLFMMINK